jgi:hypothetical protein
MLSHTVSEVVVDLLFFYLKKIQLAVVPCDDDSENIISKIGGRG